MRLCTVCLIAVISFIAIGCTRNNELKFGIMMPNFETAYYTDAIKYFEKYISEKSGATIAKNGQNNEKLQIQQTEELINDGVKVIVVDAINTNTAGAIVRIAHENKVKVIAYDRMIMNCGLDYYISFDSEKVGELMASYVYDRKPKGNYVLLYGDAADQNAHAIKKGWFNVLEKPLQKGEINIIYQGFISDWSQAEARHTMGKILRFSDCYPDVVLSAYDGMSNGVIEAIESDTYFTKQVLLTGQNCELEALRNIMKGKQSMTILKPAEILASKTAELALDIAVGKKQTDRFISLSNGRRKIPSLLMEPILIEASNIKQEIIDKGYYLESELLVK